VAGIKAYMKEKDILQISGLSIRKT